MLKTFLKILIYFICIINFQTIATKADCRKYVFKPDDQYQWLSIPQAADSNKKFPLVIIAHSSGGTGLHTATWQKVFGDNDYATYVINYYHGWTWGNKKWSGNEAKRCMGGYEAEARLRKNNTLDAVKYLIQNKKIDKERIYIIGFSAGAGFTPLITNKTTKDFFTKSVILYPWVYGCKKQSKNFLIPTLMINGSLDPNYKDCWKHVKKDNLTSIVYENVHHGFDVSQFKSKKKISHPGSSYSYYMQYDEPATAAAVQEVLNFFK
jgi:dienelactone hydrolase